MVSVIVAGAIFLILVRQAWKTTSPLTPFTKYALRLSAFVSFALWGIGLSFALDHPIGWITGIPFSIAAFVALRLLNRMHSIPTPAR